MSGKPNCWRCNKPKSQCNCGRPPKKTEECIMILEEIFRIDWTVEEACSQAWIATNTYYTRIKEDDKLYDRMTRAQQYPIIMARKTLTIWAQKDPKYAVEVLKRRDKRYSDKQEIWWTDWWPLTLSRQIHDQREQNNWGTLSWDIHSEPATEALGEAQ